MSLPIRSEDRCLNEGCIRAPDPGEAYCFPCDLERSLYVRDSRTRTPDPDRRRAEPEPGR